MGLAVYRLLKNSNAVHTKLDDFLLEDHLIYVLNALAWSIFIISILEYYK